MNPTSTDQAAASAFTDLYKSYTVKILFYIEKDFIILDFFVKKFLFVRKRVVF